MTLFDAIELDRAGDLPAAASAYEACLIEGRDLPQAMANLMALYFQSTDYGVRSSLDWTRRSCVTQAGG